MSEVPRVHVVTDDGVLARRDFLSQARRVMETGAAAVALHVRGPGTGVRVLLDLVRRLAPVREATGSVLMVNDRVDVALVQAVDGVHLGARSLPARVARELLPGGTLVGASTHGPEEAAEASAGGADYLFVGNVFGTPSHPDRDGRGVDLIREVRASTDRPLVGIGGIHAGRVADVLETGAHGVAVIRSVWSAKDPAGAVARLVDAVDTAARRG